MTAANSAPSLRGREGARGDVVPAELGFLQRMHDQGYRHVRPLRDGRWAGVFAFNFTHAIIVGRIGDELTYDDRWCYHTAAAAQAALEAWDGDGEPDGWHRHPRSGRRRSADGIETIWP